MSPSFLQLLNQLSSTIASSFRLADSLLTIHDGPTLYRKENGELAEGGENGTGAVVDR